jgi:MerR family transcriptional regulator, light-induced transcriptional regulator
MRIGAFSRRTGVSTSVLRAWETRYGLFTPRRTPGGFRLYSPADEARARRMLGHLAAGLAARESAELVLSASGVDEAGQELVEAWGAFDAERGQRALDALFRGPDAARRVTHVALPALARAADQWAYEPLGAARCHFAARQLETRLLALGERWHEAPGPLALVGCGPRDHHTLGAIAFALALHARGWRITYLGADTPVASFLATGEALRPRLVAVAFTLPWALAAAGTGLARLARTLPLALTGPAVTEEAARAAGATRLAGDPGAAAAAAAA